MTATDWEPHECSLVAVPADASAGLRNLAASRNLAARLTPFPEQDRAELAAMARAMPPAAFEAELSRRWVGLDHARGLQTGGRRVLVDEGDTVREGVAEALYSRMSGRMVQGPGRRFMGQSLVDMAREFLIANGQTAARHWPAGRIVERAFHASGDFPQLLQGSGNRYLTEVYRETESPLKRAMRMKMVPDFRAVRNIILDGPGRLERVSENAEIKHGTFNEGAELYKLSTFARAFSLSRQGIINDDMDAFASAARKMAEAASATEAAEIAAVLLANTGNGPTLADGNPLFFAARGNRAASGSALNVANLGLARAAMRKQTHSDGEITNATARFLVVGSDLETTAEQIVADITPNTVSEANPFTNLIPLVDARLPGNAWRLFADPARLPVLELGQLQDQPGPFIEMKQEWDVLGTSWRVVYDFGIGVIDWRGSYLNPGA